MSEITTVAIDDVEFDQDVYPRFEVNEDAVKRYRQVLDELPPITLAADLRLIDGYHRLRAHRVEGVSEIDAEVLDIDDDAEVFGEAARRNSTHGQQLSTDEKADVARKLYQMNGHTQSDVAEIVAMSSGWVSNKTRKVRQKERDERREKSYELYLNYVENPGQRDVAEELDVGKGTVQGDLDKILKSEDSVHSPDSPELTNVWRFQSCDSQYGTDWPGRVPGQIIENLLYYYTDEFDLVVDPMAGGGTTVDVCQEMARRYAAFDINPLEDKNINAADVTDGLPLDDSVADLVFFDPPYWRLKDDEYVDGSIADQDIDGWYDDMVAILEESARVTATGGTIALLVEPFSNPGKTERFDDLTFELRARTQDLGLQPRQRISVPLNFDTFSPQSVNDAKEKKYLIDQNRDLYVWEVGGDV